MYLKKEITQFNNDDSSVIVSTPTCCCCCCCCCCLGTTIGAVVAYPTWLYKESKIKNIKKRTSLLVTYVISLLLALSLAVLAIYFREIPSRIGLIIAGILIIIIFYIGFKKVKMKRPLITTIVTIIGFSLLLALEFFLGFIIVISSESLIAYLVLATLIVFLAVWSVLKIQNNKLKRLQSNEQISTKS